MQTHGAELAEHLRPEKQAKHAAYDCRREIKLLEQADLAADPVTKEKQDAGQA